MRRRGAPITFHEWILFRFVENRALLNFHDSFVRKIILTIFHLEPSNKAGSYLEGDKYIFKNLNPNVIFYQIKSVGALRHVEP